MSPEASYRGARPDASPAAILYSNGVMEQGESLTSPVPLPGHTLFFLIAHRCEKSVPHARESVKQYFAYRNWNRRFNA